MPIPTPPTRATSFTNLTTNNPGTPPPGDKLDAEYDRTNAALSGLISFVSGLFAPGGTLKPGSVPSEALQADLISTLAALDTARLTITSEQALKWAEYIAGPVISPEAGAAYIRDTPFPNGLYSDAIEGMSGGLFSAKWWAIQAQNAINAYQQTIEGRIASGQITFASALVLVPIAPFVGNGVQTSFPLLRADNGLPVTPASAYELLVFVNGFNQRAGTNYTLAASTITFTIPPPGGASAYALHLTAANPYAQGIQAPIDGGTYPAADDAGPSDLSIEGGVFA